RRSPRTRARSRRRCRAAPDGSLAISLPPGPPILGGVDPRPALQSWGVARGPQSAGLEAPRSRCEASSRLRRGQAAPHRSSQGPTKDGGDGRSILERMPAARRVVEREADGAGVEAAAPGAASAGVTGLSWRIGPLLCASFVGSLPNVGANLFIKE